MLREGNGSCDALFFVTTIIISITRIIPAVRKHIVPQEALAGAGVAVGVEEAAQGWVVVTGLEVVEA